MLAAAVTIVAIALNVGFYLFRPENYRSGHDNVADVC